MDKLWRNLVEEAKHFFTNEELVSACLLLATISIDFYLDVKVVEAKKTTTNLAKQTRAGGPNKAVNGIKSLSQAAKKAKKVLKQKETITSITQPIKLKRSDIAKVISNLVSPQERKMTEEFFDSIFYYYGDGDKIDPSVIDYLKGQKIINVAAQRRHF